MVEVVMRQAQYRKTQHVEV